LASLAHETVEIARNFFRRTAAEIATHVIETKDGLHCAENANSEASKAR